MENASKAMLIIAGMLLGCILLSGVLILWANISKTQSIDTGEKDQQLVEFNMEFETYCKEKIYGSEIITLLNKILSYNDSPPDFFNSKVQYDKIQLIVKFGSENKFSSLGTGIGSNVDVDFTDVAGTGKDLREYLIGYTDLEAKWGKNLMNKLSANYTKLEGLVNGGKSFKDAVQEVTKRKDVEFTPQERSKLHVSQDIEVVKKYSDYTLFKTSQFKSAADPEYDSTTGQIKKLKFESTR